MGVLQRTIIELTNDTEGGSYVVGAALMAILIAFVLYIVSDLSGINWCNVPVLWRTCE